MEIITGVERRRRWRLEEKLRIVAEVEQPGASFADVTRRPGSAADCYGTGAGRFRRGELAPDPMPVFVPVQITADASPALAGSSTAKTSTAEDTRIAITLPEGTCVRAGSEVGLVALRRVMAAVRR